MINAHRGGSQYILNYSRCFRMLLFTGVFCVFASRKAQVRAREVILELESSLCIDGGIDGAGLRCMAWRCAAVRQVFVLLN